MLVVPRPYYLLNMEYLRPTIAVRYIMSVAILFHTAPFVSIITNQLARFFLPMSNFGDVDRTCMDADASTVARPRLFSAASMSFCSSRACRTGSCVGTNNHTVFSQYTKRPVVNWAFQLWGCPIPGPGPYIHNIKIRARTSFCLLPKRMSSSPRTRYIFLSLRRLVEACCIAC